MKGHTESPPGPGDHQITSLSVLFARLTWVFMGPALLFLLTLGIVRTSTGWLTMLDAGFVIVVLLMTLGKFHELRSGSAMTTKGEPATIADFQPYVMRLLATAAGIWVAANVVGNHFLGG